MLSRRHLLAALSLLATQPVVACASPVPRVRGADLSFTLLQEAAGLTFSDRGRVEPVEHLFAGRGATIVRLRVWVNPTVDHSGLDSALVLARRAKGAGMKVLLDLHYSDTWADHSNQTTPSAWAGQDLPTLVDTVRAYTRATVRAFAQQGTPVDMIQIGNEVTSGMLWPAGQVYFGLREHWDGFIALMEAGLQGAAEGAPQPLRTLIHIDRGGDNRGARHFFDRVVGAGVAFDVIALSYYPFWHGSLTALQGNLDDLARRYGKDVLVVETSYPWMLPPDDRVEYQAARAEQLPDGARFPATPAGQAAYFEALRSVIQQVPQSRGLGFLAWEPAWLPGVGWDHGEDNPYGNLAMFDRQGAGLPSLEVFRG